jgi:hypothetical protein
VLRLVDDRNDAGDTLLPGCPIELVLLLFFTRPYCYITWPLLILVLIVTCNAQNKEETSAPNPPPKAAPSQAPTPTEKKPRTRPSGTTSEVPPQACPDASVCPTEASRLAGLSDGGGARSARRPQGFRGLSPLARYRWRDSEPLDPQILPPAAPI